MGDCFYCKEDCGWGRSVHKECKIKHYESGIKRLDSGIGLTASVGVMGWGPNLELTELMGPDMEVLESNFLKPDGEKWLWMQPETTVELSKEGQQKYEKGVIHDTTHFEEWKKCLLGISDKAIYIGADKPMRWELSKMGQVSATYDGFRVDMAESVPNQSDSFTVSLSEDEDFGAIHADWFKRLVTDALTSQASVQVPAQAPAPVEVTTPPQTSSPAEGKSIVEELRELGELKTQGFLTEEEFNKAKAKILGS
jgi:hypothetical protein